MGEVASLWLVEIPSAIIHDFKLDHGSPADIKERYASQMLVYRQAVCNLLGLSEEFVKSQILCVP